LRAAGAKTFTAKDRPSGRRFEGHGVRFAALIADDIEALPLAASSAAAPTSAAKVCAPCVTTGFAAFGLAQVPFLVVLLFAFCEREGLAAFGTSDVNVRHDWFSPVKAERLALL